MKVDGGPAFPQTMVMGPHGLTCAWDGYGVGGMTLRDYFAAKALQGMLAGTAHPGSCGPAPKDNAEFVEHAYCWADAMLAERDKS